MSDLLKTAALLGLLTILCIFLGSVLAGTTGMGAAVALALLMNVGAFWFSDRLVLAIAGAVEVSVEDAPEIHRLIGRLASAADIPKPRVYLIESTTPNAFATGRDQAHAAVALTMGIVTSLSDDELLGVLAHEVAHVRNRDTLLATIAAAIAGAITTIAIVVQRKLSFNTSRHEDGRDGDDDARTGSSGIAMLIVAPVAAGLIRLAISRTRELEADATGARILDDPLPLASALEKMALANQRAPLAVNPSIAHLFTVQPGVGQGVAALFCSQPSTAERVARLRELALRGRLSSVAL